MDRIDSVVDNSFKSLAGGKQPLFVETSVTVISLPSYRLDESSCRKVEAVVYPVADLLTQKASIPFRRKGKCLGNPQTEEGDHIHATEVHSKVSYSDVTHQ